ncbi:helix-turn-helix domain-containing protein, partial [Desulfocastanea catecholica]
IIEQLKAARQAMDLTQSEVGKKLGLPQSHVSKIEQGGTDPRLSTVSDMARVLDQELVLVPRQLLSQVRALLQGEKGHERRWQLDEEDEV